ncbi:MAG: hypothetical protein M1822_000544 [Bathelium mastoideum]|nr:MAG: hypothetical protein M1822_000544 [Bathelium mastoideum]
MSHHMEDRRIHLFASPLAEEGGHYSPAKNADLHETETSPSPPPTEHVQETLPYRNHDESLHANPAFQRHAEATSTELFYDLFFVANLTTFTSVHEINTKQQLESYVGFFSILWFSWYQVSMFDLRFAVDSIFERICKGLQFGFMVGFAVAGSQFEPDQEQENSMYFQDLSLLLMGSRFVLMFQYMVALYFTKHYLRVRVPLFLIIINYFVAAILYLGLYFAFKHPSTGPHAYIGWYIVAVAETLATSVVSSIWRLVSFKGTHMLQRMSLLTLIILGEGVIGLTKSMAGIVNNGNIFTSAVIGDTIASILVIYFFFLIYFNRLQEHHIGTFKQQIWAILHFPFHVALVLALEGSQQFILWRQGVQLVVDLTSWFDSVQDSYDTNSVQPQEVYDDVGNQLYDIAWNTTFSYAPETFNSQPYIDKFNEAYGVYQNLTEEVTSKAHNVSSELLETAGNATNAIYDAINNMYSIVSDATFAEIGIAVPVEEATEDSGGDEAEFDGSITDPKWADLFPLVYGYTFIAAGVALMIIGVLGLLSHKPKRLGGWLRAAVTIAVGLAIALLSIMLVTGDELTDFLLSPWVLPTLALAFFIVVVTDNIRKR